ncbi:hypothetical protein FRB91_002651 [Serendipita sp. 411]|nr:hypothetical protein FRB91_002651 [Serendipita sp. 411]
MALHPAFDASFFESPDDIALNQLPIYDVDDTMVRPWNVHRVLVEGALVLCRVILFAWVINNRTLCQLQTNYVKVKYRPNFVPPSSEVVTKEALPIVDRKRHVKPLNMRELEQRILITTSAVVSD